MARKPAHLFWNCILKMLNEKSFLMFAQQLHAWTWPTIRSLMELRARSDARRVNSTNACLEATILGICNCAGIMGVCRAVHAFQQGKIAPLTQLSTLNPLLVRPPCSKKRGKKYVDSENLV